MNQYRDFENEPNHYGYDEGAKFIERLTANGQHYIPIIDSAIYVPNPNNASDSYPTFDRGNSTNSFLLNPDGSLYVGAVWPGYTVFPDWLPGSGAYEWWANEIVEYYKKIKISGVWIDMSEVSSFCVGSCGSGNLTLNPVHTPFSLPGEPGGLILDYPEGFNLTNATEAAAAASASASQSSAAAATQTTGPTSVAYLRTKPTSGVRNVNYPPYTINNVNGDLAVHAVSPNATHHNGMQQYETHSLYGHQILNATYHALLQAEPGKRPFVIGRSTFVGSGKWYVFNAPTWIFILLTILGLVIGEVITRQSGIICIPLSHLRFPSRFSEFLCSVSIHVDSAVILLWSYALDGCSFLLSSPSIATTMFLAQDHKSLMYGKMSPQPRRLR